MTESDTIFESKIKSKGFFNFSDFYQFCYDWLTDELSLDVGEEKYVEKLKGNEKDVEIKWVGVRKVTDYFKFKITAKFRILGMTEVEVSKEGKKIKLNKGSIELKVKGELLRDYEGKFEKNGFLKFLRGIYEKWVIPSRINEYEGKLFGDCDEFLDQAKAYLDLSGKR